MTNKFLKLTNAKYHVAGNPLIVNAAHIVHINDSDSGDDTFIKLSCEPWYFMVKESIKLITTENRRKSSPKAIFLFRPILS